LHSTSLRSSSLLNSDNAAWIKAILLSLLTWCGIEAFAWPNSIFSALLMAAVRYVLVRKWNTYMARHGEIWHCILGCHG
jgi:hypothetical protein